MKHRKAAKAGTSKDLTNCAWWMIWTITKAVDWQIHESPNPFRNSSQHSCISVVVCGTERNRSEKQQSFQASSEPRKLQMEINQQNHQATVFSLTFSLVGRLLWEITFRVFLQHDLWRVVHSKENNWSPCFTFKGSAFCIYIHSSIFIFLGVESPRFRQVNIRISAVYYPADTCPAVLFVCFGCVFTHLYNNLNGLGADRGHRTRSGQICAL